MALSPNAGLKLLKCVCGNIASVVRMALSPNAGLKLQVSYLLIGSIRVRMALSPNAGLKLVGKEPLPRKQQSQNGAKPERGIEILVRCADTTRNAGSEWR